MCAFCYKEARLCTKQFYNYSQSIYACYHSDNNKSISRHLRSDK